MPTKAFDPKAGKKLSREVDNSLRGNALRRALRHKVPRTLTPYEWERWYAENGVPKEHLKTEGWLARQWGRVAAWLRARRPR